MTSKTLSDRIDALETRLTFQDETIETLNKTITEQWRKIDALTRQVAALSERLQEAEPAPGAPTSRRRIIESAVRVARRLTRPHASSQTRSQCDMPTIAAHTTGVTVSNCRCAGIVRGVIEFLIHRRLLRDAGRYRNTASTLSHSDAFPARRPL